MDLTPPAHASVTLACVIFSLRERVAAWGARGVLAQVVMHLLYRRLGEIGLRVERALARFRAGRVAVRDVALTAGDPGAARGGTGGCADDPRPCSVRGKRVWPGRFGWLVLAGSYEAAGLSGQLRFVLSQPEMVALLTAAPQLVAVLRPLCRALAIETAVLRPGVAVAPAVERPMRAKRARKKRPKLDLGRIPLPRGVLSAARREGYGKMW